MKKSVRQNPVLEVKSFIDSKTKRSIDSPSLRVGNKSLTVREFESNRMTGDGIMPFPSISINGTPFRSFLPDRIAMPTENGSDSPRTISTTK